MLQLQVLHEKGQNSICSMLAPVTFFGFSMSFLQSSDYVTSTPVSKAACGNTRQLPKKPARQRWWGLNSFAHCSTRKLIFKIQKSERIWLLWKRFCMRLKLSFTWKWLRWTSSPKFLFEIMELPEDVGKGSGSTGTQNSFFCPLVYKCKARPAASNSCIKTREEFSFINSWPALF